MILSAGAGLGFELSHPRLGCPTHRGNHGIAHALGFTSSRRNLFHSFISFLVTYNLDREYGKRTNEVMLAWSPERCAVERRGDAAIARSLLKIKNLFLTHRFSVFWIFSTRSPRAKTFELRNLRQS